MALANDPNWQSTLDSALNKALVEVQTATVRDIVDMVQQFTALYPYCPGTDILEMLQDLQSKLHLAHQGAPVAASH